MAIIMQSVFSPRKGFDLKNDVINGFLASVSLDYGKVVNVSASTLYLNSASTFGYFLMEQVTTSGPTMAEFILGDFQYEKKAGADVGVAVLIPKKGAVVRTKWVSTGTDGRSAEAGENLNISNGIFLTCSNSAGQGEKGKIKEVITDSISTTLYDVEIIA